MLVYYVGPVDEPRNDGAGADAVQGRNEGGDPPGDPSDNSESNESRSSDTISLTPPPPTPPPTPAPPPPPPPPPPPSPPPVFPLPEDHPPGIDGTGTMPLRQRKVMCLLRRPLTLDPLDFCSKFKITKRQFIKWTDSCREVVQRIRELDHLAQGLLFLHKMLNNESFSSLAVDFVLKKKYCRKIFWKVLMGQYKTNMNVPRLLFNNATVDDQVNRLLTESFNSTPPLIQNIFRHFIDPSGRGRIPVVLLLDATYLAVQDSTDIYLHKSLFYGPKKDHIVKLVCLTNCIGKIVGMLPLACSQSPTCGDSFLVGHFVELEEASGGAQYFRTLLRGNNDFWVILVTDAGLVTRPSRAGVNVVGLEDVCIAENCLLLHTKSGEYFLERDETSGSLSKVPTRPELRTRQAHSIVVSRLVRNINEQAHAGLKQKVGLLGAKKIPRQFLYQVGSKLGTASGLREEDHQLPRLSIITCVGAGIYNLIHPGFSIKFLDRNSQIALAQIYCSRINLENPLDHMLTWNTRLDRNISSGFQSAYVRDLNITNNLGFPLLPRELFNPLVFDVTGGPAPLIGACGILSYMSFRSIKEQNPQFTVTEVQEAISLPQDTALQYFVQNSAPEGWNSDIFGTFQVCTLVRMRCPPSHKSDSSPANWKFAVVAFSDSPDQRLSIRGPLSQILFWGCFGCPSDMGLMRTCKHVASLLMVLSFQYAFVPKTLSVGLLNPKAAPGSQTTHILPETNAGGWTDQSLGSERISRDTRQNNLLYQTGSNLGTQLPPPATSSLPSSSAPNPTTATDQGQPPSTSSPPVTSPNPTPPASYQSSPTSSSPPVLTPTVEDTMPSGPTQTPTAEDPTPSVSTNTEPNNQDIPADSNNNPCPEDPELLDLINSVDSARAFPIPKSSSFVRGQHFSVSELQHSGLLNMDGACCYMNSVLLLLHRLGIRDYILDNEYCSSSVTRNYKRSIITKVVKEALHALPSSQAFSVRNLIAAWQHIGLQPLIQLGVHEDAQEVLSILLNNLLLKIPRAETEQLLTKFQGQLTCRNTSDCSDFEFADFFDGQSDVSPFMHVIGVENDDNPVNIREKLSEFLTGTFNSRCKAIMCRKRLRAARIKVKPGKYTIVALNRNASNQSKALQKVDFSPHLPEVDSISKEPIAVISHAGSVASGHYIVYSKIDGVWFLNDDSKRLIRCQFSPFDQSHLYRETADIIVFKNKD